MKLAYLLKKFPRLSETFVLNEILGQERLGSDVHVFSRRSPDDEPAHPQLANLRATVEELPSSREINPWSEVFPGGAVRSELVEAIRRAMVDLEGIDIPRFPGLLAEAIWLRRRARELDIRHFHVHFATDSAVTAMLCRDLGGPSYSVTAHAKDIYRSTVDRRLLSRVFERSAFCVTVCDANVRWLDGLLTEDARARVRRLYNGIDLDTFRPDRGERPRGHVLSVGRLVEKKGFDVLLDALAILRDRDVEFRATIAGDGDQAEALAAQRDRLGLGECVEFAGALDQGAVRRLMSESTLFCLPCVHGEDGNRDALPTVLLEALAVGLPCISTPVTGIPEILDQGRCGLVVPERDPEATAAAIQELLDDAQERERISTAGIARAAELFDGARNAEVLKSWFDEALTAVSV